MIVFIFISLFPPVIKKGTRFKVQGTRCKEKGSRTKPLASNLGHLALRLVPQFKIVLP
jgi:hypothetical protein